MEPTWHPVQIGALEALPEGTITEVQAGERRVALLRRGDTVYAFAATCPHAGGRFCDGWVDARGLLVCPLHKYRFDPATGRNTSGEGYKLKTYPVAVQDGMLCVGVIG